MDEYTFLVLAKLEADRRKLEREQRATLPQPERGQSRNNRRQDYPRTPPVRFLAWR